jgi:hypothetical protein
MLSASWVDFSEDDGRQIVEGARFRSDTQEHNMEQNLGGKPRAFLPTRCGQRVPPCCQRVARIAQRGGRVAPIGAKRQVTRLVQ